MVPFLGFAQEVAGAALNGLDPEVEEHPQHLAEGEQHGLAIDQRQHVGAEIVLQGGEFEQVVQHHLGIGVATQLDHDPHAIAVAFIPDISNPLELLVIHQFGDPLDQGSLVGLVGKLGNDHRIAVRAPFGLDRFNRRHTAHGHRTTAGGVGLADAPAAQDLPAGGEIGTRDDRQQLLIADFRVGNQGQHAVDQFGQVVGRDVGGHTHRNASRAVQQELGDARRHHRGLLLGTVKVVGKVDRFGLDVFQQGVGGQRLQPGFGVPHGRRWVVVHRAEVAMPVDQGHAHRKVLGHPHQGVVNGRIPVGVVLTQHLTHHPGAFPIGPIAGKTQLVHRVEDAAMHGFEAIAGIGEGPSHNHAHRILQVGARHLVAEVGLNDPFVGTTGSGGFRHA